MTLRQRVAAVAVVAVLAGVVAVALVFGSRGPDDPAPLPAMVDPLLPDLVMAPIEDVGVTVDALGVQKLRFAAMFANIGEGDFLLRADRPHLLGPEWDTVQLIPERQGGHTEHENGATLLFGGDGHYHFHIREAEQHQLETLDGDVLELVVKQGFCFFDTDLLQSGRQEVPQDPIYTPGACGDELTLRSRMGLSVGWGDKYPWNMLEQHIDITAVPDGTYRIREIADPFELFIEADETNNETWADVEISTTDGYRVAEVVGRSESVLGVRENPSPGVTPAP